MDTKNINTTGTSSTKKSNQKKSAEVETKTIKTASADSKSAKTSSSASKSKASSKKSVKSKIAKTKKKIISIISVIVVILAVLWYFGGKPIVEIGAEGVSFYPTEDPIVNHIPEYLAGEYPPQTDYAEINGTENAQTEQKNEAAKTEVVESAKPSGSGNGTKGSNAQADLGHAENDPLFLGNPSDALPNEKQNENYLMVKPQYTLSYNTTTLCPNWAAWHLNKENIGEADRCDDFRPDTDLPDGWYGVKKADYQYNKYGFDRGHVCPSADRTTTKEDNSMTFLMTNMVPQSPDNNRVIWMHFECFERDLVEAGNEVYIIAGPYGSGGTSSKGTFENIPITLKSGETLYMNVPAYTWKVLIAIPDGADDMKRIDENATVIAINVPNKMGMGKTGDWEQFICSVDDIEALTGYDFFELLPDNIENKLESSKYVYTK